MPFTEDEKRRWHEDKSQREHRPSDAYFSEPIAICIHCKNPFGVSEGVITDEIALCDVCNGD